MSPWFSSPPPDDDEPKVEELLQEQGVDPRDLQDVLAREKSPCSNTLAETIRTQASPESTSDTDRSRLGGRWWD